MHIPTKKMAKCSKWKSNHYLFNFIWCSVVCESTPNGKLDKIRRKTSLNAIFNISKHNFGRKCEIIENVAFKRIFDI